MEDFEAWKAFPHMRQWFSKLYLAQSMGYDCAPGGVPPNKSAYYCVRPIYNLDGMSVGARKQWIEAGDRTGVEPGYFWCEWFDGDQYSITYEVEVDSPYGYKQKSCFKAERDVDRLFRFKKWERSSLQIPLSYHLEDEFIFSNVTVLNVEMIGDKVIEVHFRDTPDPDYDELIPVWSDGQQVVDIYGKLGYSYIEAPDNSNGYLETYRLGFMVK